MTAVTAAVGAALYPGLPARVPTHFGGGGLPDAFAPRSIATVFAPVAAAALLTVAFFGLAHALRRGPVRLRAGLPAHLASARSLAGDRAAQRVLAAATLLAALLIDVLALDAWTSPARLRLAGPAVVVFLLAVAGVIAASAVGYARELRDLEGDAGRAGAAARPQAPDDDRAWRGGLVYVDRDDPVLWVPKRNGIGWTLNLGHPAGVALAGVLLALVVASLVLVTVGG
nr:DUF5808 domain-containing protein [Kineococcus siccus]